MKEKRLPPLIISFIIGVLITVIVALSVRLCVPKPPKIVCVDIKSIIQEQVRALALHPQGSDKKVIKEFVDVLKRQVEFFAQEQNIIIFSKGSVLSPVEDKTEELKAQLHKLVPSLVQGEKE